MNRQFNLFLAGFVILLFVPSVKSDQTVVEDFSSGPFCGHYAIYAALKSLGHSPGEKLLGDRTYMNGGYGSTATDLVNIIKDLGFQAVGRKQMTLQSLLLINKPVILHVRNGFASEYTHWMVFLGIQNEQFVVYDPPRHTLLLKPNELLSLWDGYGIVVSDVQLTAFDYFFLWLPNWKSLAILAILFGVAYSLRKIRQGPVYILTLCAVSIGATAFLPPSPIIDYQFVKISIPSVEQEIPSIEMDELNRNGLSKSVDIIDARPSAYYALGHIPGAINLPIDATYGDYKVFLARRTSEPSPCIIYCQSDHCAWADTVANNLRQYGQKDVYILRPGMNGFLNGGGTPEHSLFKADHYK